MSIKQWLPGWLPSPCPLSHIFTSCSRSTHLISPVCFPHSRFQRLSTGKTNFYWLKPQSQGTWLNLCLIISCIRFYKQDVSEVKLFPEDLLRFIIIVLYVPWKSPLGNWHSYWKLPLILDSPNTNCDLIPSLCTSLPEGVGVSSTFQRSRGPRDPRLGDMFHRQIRQWLSGCRNRRVAHRDPKG